MPRFRLRSLVLLVVFLAMGLVVAKLSIENQMLRAEAQVQRQLATPERRAVDAARLRAEFEARELRDVLRETRTKKASDGK
jgi:outer membrane protein TolC